jgi:hypothetical protein
VIRAEVVVRPPTPDEVASALAGAAPLLLAHRVIRDGVLVYETDARRRGRFVARVLERFAAGRGARAALDAATLHRLA